MNNPTSMQGGTLTGVISVDAKQDPRIDNSGANYPALTDNLVPVMHNGTTWVTADVTSSTSTYGWYDYDAKKWANAVLLTETKRNSLTKDAKGNYTPGQTIGDTESDGVLAFYVWIPRYKYKVWNINKVVATDTYGAQTKGIDIVFEEGTSTTGEITCTYDFTKTSSSTVRNEECTDGGNGYYTHPAFTFGSDELTGFWMGKFEMSSSSPADESGGYITTNLTPRFLPNVRNWVVNMLSNYWLVVKNMQSTNNIYGLSTNLTVADSHLITNMDWGAVAYLTHSKYGRCTSGSSSTCTEVSKNNSRNTSEYTSITGRSEGTVGTGSGSDAGTYTYNTDGGFLASTTGTIYGVYDMHGGAMERTMGNSSQVSKGYTFYVSDAGSNYTYSGNEKYLTTYAYGESAIDQAAYNRGRLGDATGETLAILKVEQEMAGDAWYSDGTSMAKFWNPWFRRGGTANDGRDGGIFSVHFGSGGAEGYTTSRAVLTVFLTS